MVRVVWRKGGIRRTTGHWNPEIGKTGFFPIGPHVLHRRIEEPNPVSLVLRDLLSQKCIAFVQGFEYGIGSYEDLIDHVLDEASRTNLVHIQIGSDWILFKPMHPYGRMTPYESWVVDSSLAQLSKRETDDA